MELKTSAQNPNFFYNVFPEIREFYLFDKEENIKDFKKTDMTDPEYIFIFTENEKKILHENIYKRKDFVIDYDFIKVETNNPEVYINFLIPKKKFNIGREIRLLTEIKQRPSFMKEISRKYKINLNTNKDIFFKELFNIPKEKRFYNKIFTLYFIDRNVIKPNNKQSQFIANNNSNNIDNNLNKNLNKNNFSFNNYNESLNINNNFNNNNFNAYVNFDNNSNNIFNINNIQNQNAIEHDEVKINVEFQYSQGIIEIYSKLQEIMSEICKNFGKKIHKDINNIQFLYSGININMNKSLIDIINKQDKERKMMSIIALDNIFQEQSNDKKFIKVNHIICPICKESALIDFENLKIKISCCKNGHISYLLFNEFEESQKIDEAKIFCNKCGDKNKANTYKNIMYICNTCKINLCPLCKETHDQNHGIINYEQKYYICDIHNRQFNSFCNSCKKDICVLCELEHKQHEIVYYSKIIPKPNLLNKSKLLIKEVINEFSKNITEIMNKLNNIKSNLDIYCSLTENIINSYNNNNINYKILKNLYDLGYLEEQNIFKDIKILNKEMSDFHSKISNINEQMNKKIILWIVK